VRLLLRQRRPCPIGDQGPLFLGQGGVNMEHERVHVRAQLGLGRADLAHQLARTHYPRKLPRVLAPEQVARLIEAAPGPGLKYKAALSMLAWAVSGGPRFAIFMPPTSTKMSPFSSL
jgi:hypothetical protein